MSNKWMTADEWRATKGVERAEARKRAEEERDERMRVAVERGLAAFYADLAAVKPDERWVSAKIGTDRSVVIRVMDVLRSLGWDAQVNDGDTILRVTVTLPA